MSAQKCPTAAPDPQQPTPEALDLARRIQQRSTDSTGFGPLEFQLSAKHAAKLIDRFAAQRETELKRDNEDLQFRLDAYRAFQESSKDDARELLSPILICRINPNEIIHGFDQAADGVAAALTAATAAARREAIEACAGLLRRAAEISDPGWQTQEKFKSMIDATLALSAPQNLEGTEG